MGKAEQIDLQIEIRWTNELQSHNGRNEYEVWDEMCCYCWSVHVEVEVAEGDGVNRKPSEVGITFFSSSLLPLRSRIFPLMANPIFQQGFLLSSLQGSPPHGTSTALWPDREQGPSEKKVLERRWRTKKLQLLLPCLTFSKGEIHLWDEKSCRTSQQRVASSS